MVRTSTEGADEVKDAPARYSETAAGSSIAMGRTYLDGREGRAKMDTLLVILGQGGERESDREGQRVTTTGGGPTSHTSAEKSATKLDEGKVDEAE